MREEFHRPLAIATAVLFLISWAFPVVAAFVRHPETWPKWWGVFDVAIAFLLVLLVIVLQMLVGAQVNQQAKDAAYRTYRILTHGILVVLVLFFLAGDRIIWTQCLTGFAWRTWLLLSRPALVVCGGHAESVYRPDVCSMNRRPNKNAR